MTRPLPTPHSRVLATPARCICGDTAYPDQAVPRDLGWVAHYVCWGCHATWWGEVTP